MRRAPGQADLGRHAGRRRHPPRPAALAGAGRVGRSASRPRSPSASAAASRKRDAPYTLAEIQDGIEAAFPAVEMVSSRYIDTSKVTMNEAMADSIAHAGLVLGAEVPGWRDMDLKNLTVKQTCGGTVQVEKVGGNPSGDPFTPLVWLANYLPSVGLALEAGQVVTTGSCTGLLYVDGHQRVTGGFAGFGEVVVDLD